MAEGSPRILVIRLSAIGDVVRVLPALHVLRDAFPEARIDWAVERKSAEILEGLSALDNVVVFERPQGAMNAAREFLRFCRGVRQTRYDMVFDFHGIGKSGVITAFSGAPKRYGFSRPRSQECSSLFTNNKVTLASDRLNRIEENLRLVEALVPEYDAPNVALHVPHEVQESIDAFFEETFEGAKRVVAVHVPVDRPEKQWPAEYFAELADLLLADGRFEVMLTWGPGQYDIIKEVVKGMRRSPVVAPEIPDLKHYAWLVNRSSLYFGGDTGPMHIAATMGTPVVAVFGGTDPAKHAPYHEPFEVLYAGGPGKPSGFPKELLEQITPQMAYDACIRVLAKA
jgi:lipopolysaccharide heptosyltransferase I